MNRAQIKVVDAAARIEALRVENEALKKNAPGASTDEATAAAATAQAAVAVEVTAAVEVAAAAAAKAETAALQEEGCDEGCDGAQA